MSLAGFSWMVALLAALIAAAVDARQFRIPNWLTLPVLAGGLLCHAAMEGAAGFAASGLASLAGFALLLPLYLAGGMGAGDVKLMAALGAWLKPAATLEALIASCLLAGCYSLALLLRQRVRRPAAPTGAAPGRRVEQLAQGADRRARLIPFGVMIAGGLLAALAWRHWPA